MNTLTKSSKPQRDRCLRRPRDRQGGCRRGRTVDADRRSAGRDQPVIDGPEPGATGLTARERQLVDLAALVPAGPEQPARRAGPA